MFLSLRRFEEICKGIESTVIAVVGDVMLDRYLRGNSYRISPEAPVPIVNLDRIDVRIGGAANVADNIMLLGGNPELISVIGNDKAARDFLEHCSELGLTTNKLYSNSERPTTVKTRIIAGHQQVCRLDNEITTPLDKSEMDFIIKSITDLSDNLNAVIISDYGKGVIIPELVRKLVDYCHQNGILIVVDPKEQHWDYYKNVDLIKPNIHETARATNIVIDSDETLEKAGWKLLDMTGARAALITKGEAGMSLFRSGHVAKHLPTLAREVFDVTGAGDTVTAVATASLAAGATLEEAAIIANHAAGLVVAEIGTAAVTSEIIAKSMARERNGK